MVLPVCLLFYVQQMMPQQDAETQQVSYEREKERETQRIRYFISVFESHCIRK